LHGGVLGCLCTLADTFGDGSLEDRSYFLGIACCLSRGGS